MAAFNSQTEKLLALSLEQYCELLQHAENLSNMLDNCDYSQVAEYTGRLEQLQAAARQQDELLLPLLKADLQIWEEHTLYQQRLHSIRSILEINELLVPKIRGTMAVTSAELGKLRGGRTALAGYASQLVDKGGLRGIG